jgi:hypothetical protein
MNTAQLIQSDPALEERATEQMQSLLTRSATDIEFRKLLVSDSRAALSQHFGGQLPESANIVFLENKADATVVLPDLIGADAELSEAELEAVAGGASPALLIIGGCIYVLTHL